MRARGYTYPVPISQAKSYLLGTRVAVKDRDGWAVSGIIIDVVLGETVALVTIDIDTRENDV